MTDGLARTAALAFSIAAAACTRSAPLAKVPHAAASEVTWSNLPISASAPIDGTAFDEIALAGGEVLRLEAAAGFALGERVRTGAGFAETWTIATPKDGTAIYRASPSAAALLVRHGAVSRAHVARGSEPGYSWFELETRALTWAEGPLHVPFPALAAPERIDFDGFSALDRALSNGIAAAKNPADARRFATAIRRVMALRAVRGLRPVSGFPYFFDETPALAVTPKEPALAEGFYGVPPGGALETRVEGPQILHVWSRGVRGDVDRIVRLRVLEGDRVRAVGGGRVLRSGEAQSETPPPEAEPGDVPLRRAVVQVPPGEHRYKIEITGGPAFVRMLAAKPVVHFEDLASGTKSEQAQLELASDACKRGDAPAICAMALALSGKDDEQAGPERGSLSYGAALAAAPREVRAIADNLARGGPRDPSADLELAASDGDPGAMARLEAGAAESLDDVLRAAWLRGWARGTRWSVDDEDTAAERVHDAKAHETWTSLLFEDDDRPECASASETPWPEITTQDSTFSAQGFYGAPALTLLAVTSCRDPGPVGLVVDGKTLKATPGGPVATWHVLVQGTSVHAHRLEPTSGHVYAVAPEMAHCGARFAQIAAPRLASSRPTVRFSSPAGSTRGLEVWLREGSSTRGEIVATQVQSSAPPSRVRIVVSSQPGLLAIDERGTRWRRVAKVALPAWANAGVEVEGPSYLAIRGISRIPKTTEDARAPSLEATARRSASLALDEGALVRLSRKILEAPPEARGPLYLERALVLARAGAERAAYDDAGAAKSLGAAGKRGEDPLVLVRRALKVNPLRPFTLPSGVPAHGIEADFEPGAKRCGGTTGPRALMAETVTKLAALSGEEAPAWDRELAISTFAAAEANPADPRGPLLLDRALTGSWWHAVTPPELALLRVKRERPEPVDPPVDGTGALRARIVTGDPFDGAHFVTVSDRHQVKAVLAGLAPAKARVDVVCAPMSPSAAAGERCPVVFGLGAGPPVRVLASADGHASHDLPPEPKTGPPPPFVIAVPRTPARWSAVARIVLDREAPGTTHVDKVGWVIGPADPRSRLLVKAGKSMALSLERGLYRIDARAEPGESPKVVLDIDGKEEPVPPDGSPLLFVVRNRSRVTVTSQVGTSTVAFAERVGPTEPEPNIADRMAEAPREAVRPLAADLGHAPLEHAGVERVAENAPPPLSAFEDALGTFWAGTLALHSTINEEDDTDAGRDSHVSIVGGYKRRLESIDLWVGLSGLMRSRTGTPTYGASALFYEDAQRIHLRMTAGADVFRQEVAGVPVQTIAPHGFVEYSWRATRDFFVLPRLGYDGFYTSATKRLSSLSGVDEDVYNYFRAKRPTLLFGQALFWFVPYFDDIFYLRARVTADAKHRYLSHMAARPGIFLALGNLDLTGYVDAAWYAAIPYVQLTPLYQVVAAMTLTFNGWVTPGSFMIQPQVGGRVRADAPGWEAFAGINVLASRRRGLRDYSSLELDFPEQLGGGVPWRPGEAEGAR
jgi:hypothetical protein